MTEESRSLVLAVAAEESAGVQVLRALSAGGHRIARVYAQASSAEMRGVTVGRLAESLGLPLEDAARVKDPAVANELRAEGVDLLLNVHSLYLVHEEVLRAPRIGAFNLHPGPLPRYAGLNAPSWAIYHGESEYGVTVHWMEPGVDTGAIAYQTYFPIAPDETGFSLSARCVKEGVPLILRAVEDAAGDAAAIPRVAQDLSQRSYFVKRKVPEGGRVAWTRPAREVANLVRAADYYPFRSPWGTPRAMRGASRIGILKAMDTGIVTIAEPGTVARAPDGKGVLVACADAFVRVTLVRVDDKTVDAAFVLEPGEVLGDGL